MTGLAAIGGAAVAAPAPATEASVTQQAAGGVTLTASQLRINQRISQAAVRRINALTAMVDGEPPPEPGAGGTPGRVTLSAEQLLVNQRISQAAVRRANALAGRLEGTLPRESEPPKSGGTVTLSARQLLIGQRIAQAAVRRANALAERIPELPFPAPGPLSPQLDDFNGFLRSGDRAVMEVVTVRRRGPSLGDGGPVAVGDLVPVTLPSGYTPPFGDNAPNQCHRDLPWRSDVRDLHLDRAPARPALATSTICSVSGLRQVHARGR